MTTTKPSSFGSNVTRLIVTFGIGVGVPEVALAYIGPGAGLTAIGTVLALIAALFLGIVGFVWYPVKKMLRKRAATTLDDDNTEQTSESEAQEPPSSSS